MHKISELKQDVIIINDVTQGHGEKIIKKATDVIAHPHGRERVKALLRVWHRKVGESRSVCTVNEINVG